MSYFSQLRTFIAAYRLGSLSKAAEQLEITQPAASQQIRMLEAQIEKTLFVRHARGIMPTEIAHDLARSIGSHIDGIEVGFNAVQARADSISGTLHIAGPGEYLSTKIIPILTGLTSRNIRVRLHTGGKKRLYSLLDEGAIDLAITASQPSSRSLDYQLLDSETMVLVAAPDWSKQRLMKPFDVERLIAQPLIAYDEDLPLIRQYFEQVFDTILTVQAAVTVADLRAVCSLVLTQQGYSVLPLYLCEKYIQQGLLRLLYTPEHPPTNSLYLVWNRGNLRHPRVAFAREYFLKLKLRREKT
ncbi:MAG: LysR family transcriptional regulator [Cyanobacteria bacterium J06632_3]